MYPRPICPSTLVNEKLVCELPFDARKTASATKTSERKTAWPNSRSQVSPRAAGGVRERHGYADQEHERRLDQVPEHAAAPLHVVELLKSTRAGSTSTLSPELARRRTWRCLPKPSPASRNRGRHPPRGDARIVSRSRATSGLPSRLVGPADRVRRERRLAKPAIVWHRSACVIVAGFRNPVLAIPLRAIACLFVCVAAPPYRTLLARPNLLRAG